MQDIVAATQFTVLALPLFQAVAFSGGEVTLTASGIALILTQPDTQGLRGAADFRGDGADDRLLRVIVVLAFDNQSKGPLTDLGGKTCIFSHPATSLSKSLVSRITGAVHKRGMEFSSWLNLRSYLRMQIAY